MDPSCSRVGDLWRSIDELSGKSRGVVAEWLGCDGGSRRVERREFSAGLEGQPRSRSRVGTPSTVHSCPSKPVLVLTSSASYLFSYFIFRDDGHAAWLRNWSSLLSIETVSFWLVANKPTARIPLGVSV